MTTLLPADPQANDTALLEDRAFIYQDGLWRRDVPNDLTVDHFTDDFNRADGALGANWTTRLGSVAIASNKAVLGGAEGVTAAWATPMDSGAAHAAECDVTLAAGGFTMGGPMVNLDSSGIAGYLWAWDNGGDYRLIYLTAGGGISDLFVVSAGASTGTRTMRLVRNGSDLECYANGSLITTITHTALTGAYIGMGGYGAGPALDNWVGEGADSGAASGYTRVDTDAPGDGGLIIHYTLDGEIATESDARIILVHHGAYNSDGVGWMMDQADIIGFWGGVVHAGEGRYVVVGVDDGVGGPGYQFGGGPFTNGMAFGNDAGVATSQEAAQWAFGQWSGPDRVVVATFSGGTMIGVKWATEHLTDVAGFILIDPLADPDWTVSDAPTLEQDLDYAYGGTGTWDTNSSTRNPKNLAASLPGLRAKPGLMFYAGDDDTLSTDSQMSFATAYGANLDSFDIAGDHHTLHANIDPEAVLDWLDSLDWATPAPFAAAVSGSDRYLVDQHGDPWLLVGDAAWSLVGQLNDDDIELYLDDRAARGINCVLFSAPEGYNATNAPNNIDNVAPFTGTAFQSTLNSTYWARVRLAVELAYDRGITCLIFPAYLGYTDLDLDWSDEVVAASNAQMETYGGYLVDLLGDMPNIIWAMGHDRVPNSTEKERCAHLAEVLRDGTGRLFLPGGSGWPGNGGSKSGTLDWAGSGFTFDFDSLYTVQEELAVDGYAWWNRSPTMPFVFLEGQYEQEYAVGIGGTLLREQMWGSFCAGACGQFFGNNPIWHFAGSPQATPSTGTWEENLDYLGSQYLTLFAAITATHMAGWADTLADTGSTFVTNQGTGSNRVSARFGDDLGLVYHPAFSSGSISLDLTEFNDNWATVRIRRIDPASGTVTTVDASEATSNSGFSISAPAANSSGARDWLFIVDGVTPA